MTLLDLSLAELAGALGGRAPALALRRWLLAARPLPAALPARVEGVSAARVSRLGEAARLPAHRVTGRQLDADGTLRLTLDLDGASAETVLLAGPGRRTVCLSSQAGCSRACSFCATGRLGLRRALRAGEMALQYLLAAAEAAAPPRNVVFMGMGEPMDNLDEVLRAVDWLTDESSPRLAQGHVTVSTSGVLPGMRRYLERSRANLALSLNATTDEQRERLIPHNRLWPIAELLGALREGPRRRDVFIEYVLIAGVNDGEEDAARLAALLEGVAQRVNLIPLNSWDGCEMRPPATERVERFAARLRQGGLRPLLRRARGGDSAAACGQLAAGQMPGARAARAPESSARRNVESISTSGSSRAKK